MVTDFPTWHGTQEEGLVLMDALEHNCACEFDPTGARIKSCPPHDAFAHDQQWIDRLVFLRRIRDTLSEEENLIGRYKLRPAEPER